MIKYCTTVVPEIRKANGGNNYLFAVQKCTMNRTSFGTFYNQCHNFHFHTRPQLTGSCKSTFELVGILHRNSLLTNKV